MGIDNVTPPPDASSRYSKNDQVSVPAASSAKPAPASFAKAVNHAAGAAAKPEITPAAEETKAKPPLQPPEKPARSAAELQAMAEKLKDVETRRQTEQEISAVQQSITATRRNLDQATHEIQGEGMNANMIAKSYWEKLDVAQKAQTINRLKDKLQTMEIQREKLVAALQQQVQEGSYRASGEEILKGMLDEYF